MYKLGVYNTDGNLVYLRTANTKEGAKYIYKSLKDEWKCTIWVQKIEFVDPKEEFSVWGLATKRNNAKQRQLENNSLTVFFDERRRENGDNN